MQVLWQFIRQRLFSWFFLISFFIGAQLDHIKEGIYLGFIRKTPKQKVRNSARNSKKKRLKNCGKMGQRKNFLCWGTFIKTRSVWVGFFKYQLLFRFFNQPINNFRQVDSLQGADHENQPSVGLNVVQIKS